MNNELGAPILITGGTGFAGSHLVEYLLELGHSNIHVTAYGSKDSFVHSLLAQENIHSLDLTDFSATLSLLQEIKPKFIYHLAAFAKVGSSYEQAVSVMSNNSLLQWSLLEAYRQAAPNARFLAVGSAQEYDQYAAQKGGDALLKESTPLGPINPYGVSKVDQDLLALSYHYSYNLDIVRVRPFNHTGERQTADFAVPEFARQIAAIEKGEAQAIKVGNLTAIRDMSDVKDIVEGYVTVMEKGTTGDVYNVGSGQGFSMQELLDQLISLSSTQIQVVQDESRLRPQDIPSIVADITKIKALGWSPRLPLSQTLARVLEYWRHL